MTQKLRQMPVFLLAMCLLLGLALLQVLLPARSHSDLENRPLQQGTAPTLAAVASGRWMQDMERYVADQFPGREGWMYLKSVEDDLQLRTLRGGILFGRQDWLFERADHLSLRTAQANMDALAALGAHAARPVTVMLVPLSSAVLPELLPAAYEADDQAAILDRLYARLPGDVRTIDVLGPMLASGTREGLFFRTDHHWTAEGAQVGYRALALAWGLTPAAMDSAQTATATGFYGTYFARSPSLHGRGGEAIAFPTWDGVRLSVDGEAKGGLYDPDKWQTRDKYAALLWGNHGRLTLTSGAPGGTLLVLKDSYANMLLPTLAQHFSRIEVIDLRYFTGNLAATLDESEAEQILCLYGLTTLLTDRSLPLHTALWEG